MSTNAEGGGSYGFSVQLYTGAQLNFGELTQYLTYGGAESQTMPLITSWSTLFHGTQTNGVISMVNYNCRGFFLTMLIEYFSLHHKSILFCLLTQS
jgi:hypothetical protein